MTITRDAYGVPAIRAGSERDAWFGAGYAVAQDRLVELELFRRSTQGRLAEVLGESRLQSDIVARRDYFTKAELRKQLNRQPAALRARFDAYAEGVNAWLAKVAADPSLKPARARAPRAHPGAVDAAGLGVDRRAARPHRAQRRRRRAGQLARAARARRQALRAAAAAPPAQRPDDGARLLGPLPVAARPDAPRRAHGLPRLPRLPQGPEAAEGGRRHGARPRGGSFHYALRGAGGSSYLFSAPQLGFSLPELFVELEVHAPGLDVRGVTGPGIPVIAVGHNGRIAWGITSGLDDDDDLYVERLAGKERYRFKGRTRKMRCRTETIRVSGAKSSRQRICRTVHGPVQARTGSRTAFSRRYAIWGREMDTLQGLARLNAATSVAQAGEAAKRLTWNENLLVADDAGHIGWWHPGLLPLRPKRWDERLPLPGDGKAEWRGVLPFKALPKVIDPAQGWIANWNNMPSAGWTNGDAPAAERNVGDLNRGRLPGAPGRAGGGEPEPRRAQGRRARGRHDRAAAPADRLAAARRRRRGDRRGRRRCWTPILAWDGNYDRVDASGTVDPGVAAFEALKEAAEDTLPAAAVSWLGQRGGSHPFDIGAAEAAGLHALDAEGLAAAAADAAAALQPRFDSADPAAWREPRKMYDVEVQGVADKPAARVLRPRDVLPGGRTSAPSPEQDAEARALGGAGGEQPPHRRDGVGHAPADARGHGHRQRGELRGAAAHDDAALGAARRGRARRRPSCRARARSGPWRAGPAPVRTSACRRRPRRRWCRRACPCRGRPRP